MSRVQVLSMAGARSLPVVHLTNEAQKRIVPQREAVAGFRRRVGSCLTSSV